MTDVFRALGKLVTSAPRTVVVTWVVLVAVVGAWALTGLGGQGLFDRLEGGSEPVIAGSESTVASEALSQNATSADTVTMVVTGIDVADPATQAAVVEVLGPLTAELAELDGVLSAVSPAALPGGVTDPQAAPFVATGGDGVAVVASIDIDSADADATHDAVEEVMRSTDLTPLGDEVDAHLTSGSLVVAAINAQIQKDLVVGEAIGLPIALLIMVLVFGGFLAAAMPVVGALASIAVGMGALLALTHVMDIQSFVVNVVTVLGLGLSIDYGLLVVSRFREEMARVASGAPPAGASPAGGPAGGESAGGPAIVVPITKGDERIVRAVRTTVETAGRTVFFSAVTVAISVSGLFLMKPDVLTTISAGAVVVVLLAVVAAVTLIPAILTVIGHRLATGSALEKVPGLGRIARTMADNAKDEGAFSTLARFVHRHPWAVLLGVVALLAVLVAPLANMTLRASTFEMVPTDTDTGQALAVVAADYPALGYGDIHVVADAAPDELGAWTQEVLSIDGVADVRDPGALEGGLSFVVVDLTTDDAGDATGVRVTEEIRAIDPGFETWTGGTAGAQIDFTQALVDGLPLTAGVVVLAVFILLFLMTGSVLIPLKALLINLLSIAASLGLTTWLFTTEAGSSLIGLAEPHRGLETYVVAIIVAFGFGLAMDYEVFLLARIKEYWDATGDNDLAVERGLQRSGRIITSAALIIIAVFLGFALGDVDAIQQVGLGLALTVAIDATLVRLLLVPATMTLLGKWNWWAPKPLQRLYARFSIEH